MSSDCVSYRCHVRRLGPAVAVMMVLVLAGCSSGTTAHPRSGANRPAVMVWTSDQCYVVGTQLLTGQPPTLPPTEQPGSIIEGDPGAWWDTLAGPGRAAIDGVDLSKIVDSPMGPRSIADGLRFPAIDLFIHGWDLARSTGRHAEIPRTVIEFARDKFVGLPDTAMRDPRVFGPAREADATASPSEAFLAWTGRDPSWAPPTR